MVARLSFADASFLRCLLVPLLLLLLLLLLSAANQVFRPRAARLNASSLTVHYKCLSSSFSGLPETSGNPPGAELYDAAQIPIGWPYSFNISLNGLMKLLSTNLTTLLDPQIRELTGKVSRQISLAG